MTPVEWVVIISSIVSLLAQGGVQTYSGSLQALGSNLQAEIKRVSGDITKAMKEKRIKLNSIVSALQSKSSNSLSAMISSNPVLSNIAQQIAKNDRLLSEISSKYSALESTLADLKNDLNGLNYVQTFKEASRNDKAIAEIENQEKSILNEMDNLAKEGERVVEQNKTLSKPNLSHLDAITQNTFGGLKQ